MTLPSVVQPRTTSSLASRAASSWETGLAIAKIAKDAMKRKKATRREVLVNMVDTIDSEEKLGVECVGYPEDGKTIRHVRPLFILVVSL